MKKEKLKKTNVRVVCNDSANIDLCDKFEGDDVIRKIRIEIKKYFYGIKTIFIRENNSNRRKSVNGKNKF